MKLDNQLKREFRPNLYNPWDPQIPMTALAAKVLENERRRNEASLQRAQQLAQAVLKAKRLQKGKINE